MSHLENVSKDIFVGFPGIVFEMSLPSQKPECTYPTLSESVLT